MRFIAATFCLTSSATSYMLFSTRRVAAFTLAPTVLHKILLLDSYVVPRSKAAMHAWTCHGESQREMVDNMVSAQIVQTPMVQDILYKIDRADYAPKERPGFGMITSQPRYSIAYQDAPQPIGLGQTISAPHMHAHALEEILPYLDKTFKNTNDDGDDVPLHLLDVGCGSGYLTAALGRWLQLYRKGNGVAYGMEVHDRLVQMSRDNMLKHDGDLLKSGLVELSQGNGWEGWPKGAPYHAIHVGAAAADYPVKLIEQLALGGIMIMPLGPDGGMQRLIKIVRVSGNRGWPDDFEITPLLHVRYVPLIQQPH